MNRSTEADFDQRIADWLEDDPRRAPTQAADTVLAAFPSIPQRRAVRVPWRFPRMTMPVRLAAAAVIGALVLGGALLLAGGGSRPSSSIPNPVASATAVTSSAAASPRATAGVAWRTTGSPAEDRGVNGMTIALKDGRVLVFGGGKAPLKSAELYDPTTGTWAATGSMNTERSYPLAARLADGRVLVAGGYTANDETASSAEIFDPTTGKWTLAGEMSESRAQGFGVALADGRVLAAGGGDDNGRTSADLYDPSSGKWTPTGSMSTSRAGPLVPVVLGNGNVLVAGGFNDDQTSALLYVPKTGTWSPTGSMRTGRADEQSAILLANGQVLICGGRPTSCDAYDPATGGFTGTDLPPESSNDLLALTQLKNGRVLLAAGGTNLNRPTTAPTSKGQLFDPVTGHWSVVPQSTTTQVYVRSASLLPDGTVLVVRSDTSDAGGTPSAEIYTP
jgi:hypothetical protein